MNMVRRLKLGWYITNFDELVKIVKIRNQYPHNVGVDSKGQEWVIFVNGSFYFLNDNTKWKALLKLTKKQKKQYWPRMIGVNE